MRPAQDRHRTGISGIPSRILSSARVDVAGPGIQTAQGLGDPQRVQHLGGFAPDPSLLIGGDAGDPLEQRFVGSAAAVPSAAAAVGSSPSQPSPVVLLDQIGEHETVAVTRDGADEPGPRESS